MGPIPHAGPSSPRKSHSFSPSARSKTFGSSDALSPELPPTYNSLGTHVDARRGSFAQVEGDDDVDTERLRLLQDRKGKSRRSSDADEDELDALRLDLDGIGQPTTISGQGDESARLAMTSIDQRKALWWKNVLITGVYIASW